MKKTFKDFMHDGREDAKRRYTECTGRQWDEENPNYSVLAPYHPENIDEKHWAILCNTVYFFLLILHKIWYYFVMFTVFNVCLIID